MKLTIFLFSILPILIAATTYFNSFVTQSPCRTPPLQSIPSRSLTPLLGVAVLTPARSSSP